MKMMLLCETAADKEAVARIFDKMVADAAENIADENMIEGGVLYREDGICGEIYATEAPIVYAFMGDSYTVYNFKTMKKTDNVEGGLAGLCNLPEEDFPIF